MTLAARKSEACPIPGCPVVQLQDGQLVCMNHYLLIPRACCLEIARFRSMVLAARNARLKLLWSRRLRIAKERAILTAIDNSKPKAVAE